MCKPTWSLPLKTFFIKRFDLEKKPWSDKTKMGIFGVDSTLGVWRKRTAAYDPKNTSPTAKHGGENIMLWGCFFHRATSPCGWENGVSHMPSDFWVRTSFTPPGDLKWVMEGSSNRTAKEEALRSWSGPEFSKKGSRCSKLPETSTKSSWFRNHLKRVDQNSSWSVQKLVHQLQETPDLCVCWCRVFATKC